ncbi:unannotated protein [freshwater metagenome]|uniref:Unannotated protein n=1 Tax=freshwater metagenome TaxID=449393 RepID=A0A6J7K8R8_9ZZZZ|nr:hypothetical protein [Actinomycetota bacterium]
MATKNTLIAVAAATAAFAGLPTAASAASSGAKDPSDGLVNAYDTVYDRVVDAGGEPGRNIAEDGVREDGDARPATRSEVVESLTTLRRMHVSLKPGSAQARASLQSPVTGSATPAVAGGAQGTAPAPASSSAPAPASGGGLESVAQCESGGDPSAVSPDGQYRGKYQFDQQTWNSVGGSGDPAAAPEAEQDARAAQLQAQRGSSPWPVCG